MNKATCILVVDDDPEILETFSIFLRRAGYVVWQASTGEEGLKLVSARGPDLVLLDVMLPDLSGIEVCRQIKREPALANIFVVLFSGEAVDPTSSICGLEAGADDYIAKTMAPIEFLARIRTMARLQQSAAALRSSEERFRQLAENIREVFWMTDPAKREMIYISPGYEAIWGRSCESLYATPRDWVEALHPEDRQRVLEAALTKQAAGNYNEDYRILRPDGSVRWIQDRAFPIRDQSGAVYRVVGIAEDITERKQTEAKLAMLAHGVESTTEPICITDLADRFIFVNRAFQRTYGYTEAEVLGKSPEILFSLKNPPRLMEEILRHSHEEGWRGEVLDRRKDGTEFPIFLSTSQIQDQGGQVIGLMGVAQDITERKRAEEQIRLLADAIQSTQEMICITDRESHFTFVNRAFLETYGYREEEVLGQEPGILYSPNNPPGFYEQIFLQTLAGGWKGEVLNLRRDGSEFPISLTTSRIRNREGEILGLIGVARDISDRKRIEHQRAAAEANYRSIFEHATEGIFRTTPEGQLLSANPALAKMFGYTSPEEFMTATTDIARERYLQPERRAEFRRLLEAQGSVEGFEAENFRKDGSTIWISLNAHVVRDSNGAALYYEGTLQDVTERKRAEDSLSQSQRLQKALLDNISDPAWLRDADGRFLAGNEALARFFGRPLEQVIGKTLFDLTPKHAPRLTRSDNAVKKSRKPAIIEELLVGADGYPRWLETIKSPIFGDHQEVTGIVGVARDISERKWAQGLLQLQRDFGTFLSGTDDLRAAAERLLKVSIQNEGLDCGAVYLVNGATGTLELAACEGLSAGFSERAARFPQEPRPTQGGSKGRPVSPARVAPMDAIVRELKAEGLSAVEILPIHHGGQVVAILNVGSHLYTEIPARSRQTIDAIATQAGGAITRIRAEEELRQLPQRIIKAQEAERLRVARELHDGVNQLLASAKMRLRRLQEIASLLGPAAREILARCDELLVQALEENRRIAHNLRPSDLDALGLATACRNFCKLLQSRSNLVVKCSLARLRRRLSPAVELNLFRIVQEAVTNVEKHAQAKTVRVRLSAQARTVTLEIEDDGRGFEPEAIEADKGAGSGIGLTNMRERAASLGGSCEVISLLERGTRITVRVPREAAS